RHGRPRLPTRGPPRSHFVMLSPKCRADSSADDARHTKEAGILCSVWRVANRVVHRQTGAWLVVALRTLGGVDMRRGRDTARIDRLHLLGVMKNVSQLFGEQLLLLFAQLELRERGDAFDVCDREYGWHWLIVIQNSKCEMRTSTISNAVRSHKPQRHRDSEKEFVLRL